MVKSPIPGLNQATYDFLATFGQVKDVKQEVKKYWKQEGRFVPPEELYAHLMEQRVQSGEISPGRAGVLRAAFNHSFVAEPVTGYLAKHREPLVTGLAELYAKQGPIIPDVWRIEGDISNLGGLNEALVKSAKVLQETDKKAFEALLAENTIQSTDKEAAEKLGRIMADRVLHAICQITLKHLEEKADVMPIRNGGDEIKFIATLHQDVTPDEMQAAIRKTMRDVAKVVTDAGLKFIPHRKNPDEKRLAGVGVGLHFVNMREHGADTQQHLIEGGIRKSKDEYQTELHRGGSTNEITVPDMRELAKFLKDYPPQGPYHTVIPNLNATGSEVPDQQRRVNLEKIISGIGAGELSNTEKDAVIRTHASLRKLDPVTALPMYEYMEEEQLPNLINKFGENGGVKLVNIDFSGMAGGNKLSEELGDAMACAYRDALLVAMKRSGLRDYLDEISVRPGGKFTLLLPADTPERSLQDLRIKLKPILDQISEKPLELDASAMLRIHRKIDTDKDLQKIYSPQGERLFDEQGRIAISRVIDSRWLPGSTVAMAVSDKAIDPGMSLDEQLKPLETIVAKLHEQLYRERLDAGEAMPPSKAADLSTSSSSTSLPPK